MKRIESVERHYCDICGESGWYRCMNCKKDICNKHTLTYAHAAHFSGSHDGTFCADCVAKLLAQPTPLFLAYRAIQALRAEQEAFFQDHRERSAAAEKEVSRQFALYKQANPDATL